MSGSTIPYDDIKKIVKESLLETLVENKELFHDLFIQAIEDISMVEAINEGRKTEILEEDEIMKNF
jgi:hypothetical protein